MALSAMKLEKQLVAKLGRENLQEVWRNSLHSAVNL
jgi:hypothetical protein